MALNEERKKAEREIKEAEEEEEAQRRSFAYGNTKLANPDITRETVDDAAQNLQDAVDSIENALDGCVNSVGRNSDGSPLPCGKTIYKEGLCKECNKVVENMKARRTTT